MAKKVPTAKKNERKIFVLDTSVIIYDHTAIKHFKEHDVVIPITVLEELDNFKIWGITFDENQYTEFEPVFNQTQFTEWEKWKPKQQKLNNESDWMKIKEKKVQEVCFRRTNKSRVVTNAL